VCQVFRIEDSQFSTYFLLSATTTKKKGINVTLLAKVQMPHICTKLKDRPNAARFSNSYLFSFDAKMTCYAADTAYLSRLEVQQGIILLILGEI